MFERSYVDGIENLLMDIENNIKTLHKNADFDISFDISFDERMTYYKDLQYYQFHYIRLNELLKIYSYI